MNIDPIELLMLLLVGLFMLGLGPLGLVLSFLFGLLGVGWLG
jgi:hypothetical protein